MKRARDYGKEYDDYHGMPEQKKRRAARNKARLDALSTGAVRRGDGKEIDHVNNNPRDNSPGNTRVVSRKANRSRLRRNT